MKKTETLKLAFLFTVLFFSFIDSNVYGQLYEQFVDQMTENLGVKYDKFNLKHDLFGGFKVMKGPEISDNGDSATQVSTMYSNEYKPGALILITRIFSKNDYECKTVVLFFAGHKNLQLIEILTNHFNTTQNKILKNKNEIAYWYQNYNDKYQIQSTIYEKMISMLNCVVVEIGLTPNY